MDVLMLLADHAGQVVSREELFASVWPGSSSATRRSPRASSSCARALGDNSRSPAYIETISKRGYRLIAPVVQVDRGASAALDRVARMMRRRNRGARPASLRGLGRARAGSRDWPDLARSWHRRLTQERATTAEVRLDHRDRRCRSSRWASDRDQAYLARGIGDDLLTELSRVSGPARDPRVGLGNGAIGRPRAATSSPAACSATADTLRINVHLVDTADRRAAVVRALRAAVRRAVCGAGRDRRQAGRAAARQGQRRRAQQRRQALHAQPRGLRPVPARAGAVPGARDREPTRRRGALYRKALELGSEVRARLRGPCHDACDGRRLHGDRDRAAGARDGRSSSPRPPGRSIPISRKCTGRSASCTRRSRRHAQAIAVAGTRDRAQPVVRRRLCIARRHPYLHWRTGENDPAGAHRDAAQSRRRLSRTSCCWDARICSRTTSSRR